MNYLRYFWHLLKHKRYVMIECFREGLIWRGLVHDLDKFRPSQFIPYVNYYHNDCGKKAFDAAWERHKKGNKHHWQYWLLPDGTLLEMEYPYNLEMFCDWIGAGKARGKHSSKNDKYAEVRSFYLRKKNEKDEKKRMKLHENTQKWVEKKLFSKK